MCWGKGGGVVVADGESAGTEVSLPAEPGKLRNTELRVAAKNLPARRSASVRERSAGAGTDVLREVDGRVAFPVDIQAQSA